MAIMTCPKCGGCGKVLVNSGDYSAIAPYETACSSCGGLGYVTDKQLLKEGEKEVSDGNNDLS